MTGDGVKDQNIRGYGTIAAGEPDVYEGYAMAWDGTDLIVFDDTAGIKFAGLAFLSGSNDPAQPGDYLGLDHWGVRIAYDSEEDTLELGHPVKCSATVGKEGHMRLWVAGTDTADELIGYVEKTKDADKKILVRMAGGR